MGFRSISRLFLLVLVVAFFPTASVFADMGPKPEMDFQFIIEVDQPLIESGILYECYQPDCSDAEPLEKVAVQGMLCNETSCFAVSYGFAPYHKLEIAFTDGQILESNIFETVGHISEYTVTVREDGLLVEPRFNLVTFLRNLFLRLLCCPTAVIMGLPAALSRRKKQ